MKRIYFFFFLVICLTSKAQTHQDTIRMLQQTAALYDLNFTEQEADSMIGNILQWKRVYVNMHKQLPKNDLAFPFAFNPAPSGFKVPMAQKKLHGIFLQTSGYRITKMK